MEKQAQARFVVGIDLGTTNSAVAYVDTQASEPRLEMLDIAQVVKPGAVEQRPTLPSFLYLSSTVEFAAGALDLPWAKARSFTVGTLARDHGWQVPMRLVSSAKSWLCHGGVDRTAAILPPIPPGADKIDVERVSPIVATTRYLEHVRDAWDATMAKGASDAKLSQQDVLLTVPASFDAVARELTARAASQAGLEVTLLEEPQAAFYSWLGRQGDGWRRALHVGDLILVCDVGGGTTDFSLIAVGEEDGNLILERVAVGDHILLGGDNMDLALALGLAKRLADEGKRLDPWQSRSLVHACRAAKEQLLVEGGREAAPVAVLGRGRSVVGGTIATELRRGDVEELLLDGFFPACSAAARPEERRRIGLRELGLPFAADPAVTRHLAKFLGDHLEQGGAPSAVLFNGGVMKGAPLRQRIVETLAAWSGGTAPAVLEGTDFDLAVAHGAAYYGLVRRGRGVRIRGGTARSYYVGLETSMPAVPGMAPPLKAVCVAPCGMEEGTETDVANEEFGLVVGQSAEFRFLSSTTRRDDAPGAVLEDLEGIQEISPVEAELPALPGVSPGEVVPVRLRVRVTEVGTLELWCVAREGQKWKLEFDIRARE